MKCIYCGVDSPYRMRPGRACSGCGKRFAFEPKDGDRFTDVGFKAAIDSVSAKGQIRWGVEHLYYEICRRKRRRMFQWKTFVVISLGLIGFLFFVEASSGAFSIVLLAWLGFWLFLRSTRGPIVDPNVDNEFNGLWQRWVAVHGEPPGLIVRKPQAKTKKVHEPDIGDYSFDRAVICDRARTVDLLVANNFHFENNCAVLSIGGYPEGPFETIRTMLKRNPKLQVFALHDATIPGCQLAHRLANDPSWFKGQASVTDVGLRPRHAKPFQRLLFPPPAGKHGTPAEGISPEELSWLNQNVLELAVIRPEQILKRLFRAINGKETAISDEDTSGVYYDDRSFSSDAADSDGGADSFG